MLIFLSGLPGHSCLFYCQEVGKISTFVGKQTISQGWEKNQDIIESEYQCISDYLSVIVQSDGP